MNAYIVTHPGGAHADDFLSCCLLSAKYGLPIERRDPVEADLKNSEVFVVDIGGEHDQALNNYDHHQFPMGQEPVQCALSLILKHLGLYEIASAHCPWLEVAERMDVYGPNKTATWLGVTRDQLAQLHSPVNFSIIKLFSKQTELQPSDALYEIMSAIGSDMIQYLEKLEDKINWLRKEALVHPIEKSGGKFHVLQLVREETIRDDQSLGVFQFIQEYNDAHAEAEIIGTIMPDRRGEGYSLSRYQDHPTLDFNRVKSEERVNFVHASGFVAKVEATEEADLLALFSKAFESVK